MRALIVFVATVALFGCASSDHLASGVPNEVALKAGERAAEQQRVATDCQAGRHHPSYSLADRAEGDVFAIAVSLVLAPASGVAADGQIDDPAHGAIATPSGCRPRRRHHYYA
jgi:hypothetical protein